MKNQIKSKKETSRTGFTLMGPKGYDRNKASGRTETYKNAFTLIELIVVMAIIGILVLLATPKFLGYTERARETKHIHTAKVIETALEAYLINGGVFPDDLNVVDITLLKESASKETLIGVGGYVTSVDEEVYYELTYDFIQKLDVKLSAKNALLIEANASSVPTAVYASEKGIAFVDKEKTMKGYELQPGELPNEINPNSVKQLVAGHSHSMALLKDGSVMAWGWNNNGQLGDGTTTDRSTPVKVQISSPVKTIAGGDYHSMALLEDGSVMAWGWNTDGQLGDGTTTHRSTPVKVQISNPARALSAGYAHSMALLEDGSVMAWGNNYDGQLGDGTTTHRSTPVKVQISSPVRAISVGYYYSMALLEDGSVMAWGLNNRGQLGDGTKTNRRTPVKVQSLDSTARAISGGVSHSMALLKDGSVMAWGRNAEGQLGDGTTTDRSTPVKVQISNPVRATAGGFYHSMALLEDGSVVAWGHNLYGQLGDEAAINRSTPVKVQISSLVRAIAGGQYHSMALLEDGSVISWGRNDYGQLGNGTTEDESTPTLITIP